MDTHFPDSLGDREKSKMEAYQNRKSIDLSLDACHRKVTKDKENSVGPDEICRMN